MGRTPQRVIDLLKEEIPAKISLNQFCKQTGINPNSVDKYLAGNTEPTQVSFEKLSKYFRKPASWLRGEEESEIGLFIECFQKFFFELIQSMPEELKGFDKRDDYFKFADDFMLKYIDSGGFEGLSEERINFMKEKVFSGLIPPLQRFVKNTESSPKGRNKKR